MLERDVAEGDVGRTRGEIERLAIGNVARAEPVDLAETADCLEASLKESGIEVTGRDRSELASECTGHSTDTATDLDERLCLRVRGSKPEDRQIRAHFGITGGDELFQRQVVTLFVVEHPAGPTHHLVAT